MKDFMDKNKKIPLKGRGFSIMVIVMMGPPGSGKGTQSEMLSYVYSIPIISTGVMLRDALKDGSRVGKYARRYMQMGKLITRSYYYRTYEE